MITIACVQTENYCGQGAHYVNCLAGMVERNLTVPYRFVCLTDDIGALSLGIEARQLPSGVRGWWAKLALFKPGMFNDRERVLYFDLDTVITGNIDDYARYSGGFAGLGDFRSGRGSFASGILAWEAGTCDAIWNDWEASGRPIVSGGDDHWITLVRPAQARLQRLYPGIVSYKFHKCSRALPAGARIICFQREPKPHNCGAPWIAEHWKP